MVTAAFVRLGSLRLTKPQHVPTVTTGSVSSAARPRSEIEALGNM